MEIKFHQHVAGILSARLQLHHAGMAGQNQEVRGRRPSLGSVHCSEIKRGPRQRHHKEKAEEDDQVCSFDVLFFKQKKKQTSSSVTSCPSNLPLIHTHTDKVGSHILEIWLRLKYNAVLAAFVSGPSFE